MIDEGLAEFLDAMHGAPTLDNVKTRLNDALLALGFDAFAYVQQRAPGGSRRRLYIGTYPSEWSAHYAAEDLQIIDPLYFHAYGTIKPFLWSDVRAQEGSSTADARVFEPAARYGLRSGGGIPIHGPSGGLATLHVAVDDDEANFAPLFHEHRYRLRLMAFGVHEAVLRLTAGATIKIEIPDRPKEVLLWAARGMTNAQIGEKLGIKEDTVRQHVRTLCDALNAANRTEMASIAITHFIVDLNESEGAPKASRR